MTVRSLFETYRSLRRAPIWKLLASDTGPLSVAILQTLLYEEERALPASLFLDRLAACFSEVTAESRSREEVRAIAQRWTSEGYLVCRLPAGADEETYELTSDAQDAVRLLSRLQTKRVGPTESRLELLTHALSRLAGDTDRSPSTRIEQLKRERERIEEEIRAIEAGRSPSISDRSALDRTQEILDIYGELRGDFRRVRESFERLNRELRTEIMQSEGPRGTVLERFFKGYDLIEESDEGLAFQGFYKLLSDRRSGAEFEDSLARLRERSFWKKIPSEDRRRISRMQYELQLLARETNSAMKSLTRSLKQFVESQEFLEEKHLAELIREARRSAQAAAASAGVLDETILFPSIQLEVDAVSRLVLDDPEEHFVEMEISRAEPPALDSEAILARILQADIDYPALIHAVEAALMTNERPSIAEVFRILSHRQGLGSVVGLLSLALRCGVPEDGGDDAEEASAPDSVNEDALAHGYRIGSRRRHPCETLEWTDRLGARRRARIPIYRFTAKSLATIRTSR